jgi:hypothetical protein
MKIEKKIPIPPLKKGGEDYKIIAKMKIGDSVFFENNNLARGRRFVGCAWQSFRDKRFTTRTTNEGMRIWRIE